MPVYDDSPSTAEDITPAEPCVSVPSVTPRAGHPRPSGWSFCTPTAPTAGEAIDPAWLVFLGVTPPSDGAIAPDADWQALLRR